MVETEVFFNKIKELGERIQKKIPNNLVEQLSFYVELVLAWNKKINLISRKDTEHIFENHLAPCLLYYLLGLFSEEDNAVIDIGSGGGFPGMVNAICYPKKKIVFLEATAKKVKVLEDMVKRLNLTNTSLICGRAEKVAFEKKYNQAFDVCTSRGVAPLERLIPLSISFLKKRGCILCIKGGDLTNEIRAVRKPSRYTIIEYETEKSLHYIKRFQTLKIVEISRAF